MKEIKNIRLKNSYDTFPDMIRIKEKTFLVYQETEDLERSTITRLRCIVKDDGKESWNNFDVDYVKKGVPYWNKAKFLQNSDEIILVTELLEEIEQEPEIHIIENVDLKWKQPLETGIRGYLSGNPIKLKNGGYIVPIKKKNPLSNCIEVSLYKSNDLKNWIKLDISFSDRYQDFSDSQLLYLNDDVLCILFREESKIGWDLYSSCSKDEGKNWTKPQKMQMRGSQIPKAVLIDKEIYLSFSQEHNVDDLKTVVLAKTDMNLFIDNPKRSIFEILKHKKSNIEKVKDYGFSSIIQDELNNILVTNFIKNRSKGEIRILKL